MCGDGQVQYSSSYNTLLQRGHMDASGCEALSLRNFSEEGRGATCRARRRKPRKAVPTCSNTGTVTASACRLLQMGVTETTRISKKPLLKPESEGRAIVMEEPLRSSLLLRGCSSPCTSPCSSTNPSCPASQHLAHKSLHGLHILLRMLDKVPHMRAAHVLGQPPLLDAVALLSPPLHKHCHLVCLSHWVCVTVDVEGWNSVLGQSVPVAAGAEKERRQEHMLLYVGNEVRAEERDGREAGAGQGRVGLG